MLHAFQCTEPSERQKIRPWHEIHHRPWELSLQREIHTLNPRCTATRAVPLGEDDEGLAAVTVVEMRDGPNAVVIECVAVAL